VIQLSEWMRWTKEEIKRRGLVSTGFHLPYNPDLKERSRELRKNMTDAEKKIWFGYLKSLQVNVLRQKPIDHFIVDFYIPDYNLVIEIDGEIHNTLKNKEYDSFKDTILKLYGLSILRITNEMIVLDFNRAVELIEEKIKSKC
jgi:very-short-patch-repair endonuclease